MRRELARAGEILSSMWRGQSTGRAGTEQKPYGADPHRHQSLDFVQPALAGGMFLGLLSTIPSSAPEIAFAVCGFSAAAARCVAADEAAACRALLTAMERLSAS